MTIILILICIYAVLRCFFVIGTLRCLAIVVLGSELNFYYYTCLGLLVGRATKMYGFCVVFLLVVHLFR